MTTHKPTCIWFPCTCDVQVEKINENEKIKRLESKLEKAIQVLHQIQETYVCPDDEELVTFLTRWRNETKKLASKLYDELVKE